MGQIFADLSRELGVLFISILSILPALIGYVAIILLVMLIVSAVRQRLTPAHDYTSLKTVTFGDESAVVSNKAASIISVVLIFVIWGAFTGTSWLPGFLHAPGPFLGQETFTYTVEAEDGSQDDATVTVIVHKAGEVPEVPEVDGGDGLARNDVLTVQAYRSKLLVWDSNDEISRNDDGAKIIAIDGRPITRDADIDSGFARVALTDKGTLNIEPGKGWQMESIW
ncbi:MAG: ABC transporter permease, partial [Silicimonas sp.]|nr:ABC transporter permease [Silicimonas sp.]